MKRKYDYAQFKYLNNVSGIYEFYNTITNKGYIGRSLNIYLRIGEHLRHSFNKNDNNYSTHFYKALRKYPIEQWNVKCIYQSNDLEELILKEREYISKYDTVNNGYNSTYETKSAPIKRYEDHGNSLLRNYEIYDIRDEYAKIKNPKEIYEKYKNKISYKTFLNIWRGHSWVGIHMDVYTVENKNKHLTRGNQDKIYKDSCFERTRECVYKIRQLYAEEILSQGEVYEMFNFLNKNTFNDIWYGKTFTEICPELYIEVKKRGRKYIRRGNNKNGNKNKENSN